MNNILAFPDDGRPGVNTDGSIDVLLFEPKPLAYAVQGIFLRKEANVLFGAGGTDKSTLMADLAVSVVYGLPWLGRKALQGPVLYLDWESSGERYRPTYLIIDSMGFAMGGDTQKEALVLQVFESLSGPVEEHDVCLIFVDHTPHGDKEKEYGSEYKRNAVRAQWLIKESESRPYEVTADGERIFLELVNKKLSFHRGDDSLHVKIEFHDTFDQEEPDGLGLPDGPIHVCTYDPMDIPCVPGAGVNKELLILNALPAKATEIAERTDIPLSYVKDILSRLRKAGKVDTRKGVWYRR
jgi:hypothetical protein